MHVPSAMVEHRETSAQPIDYRVFSKLDLQACPRPAYGLVLGVTTEGTTNESLVAGVRRLYPQNDLAPAAQKDGFVL
jgi:hypothetical protein